MEEEKKVITWNDVVRSEKPLDWKKILDRVAMTPDRLNAFLSKMIEDSKKKPE